VSDPSRKSHSPYEGQIVPLDQHIGVDINILYHKIKPIGWTTVKGIRMPVLSHEGNQQLMGRAMFKAALRVNGRGDPNAPEGPKVNE
jgi:hypothetical protein